MNAPHRQRNTLLIQRGFPGEHVLVHAVDESAVEVEQKGCFVACHAPRSSPLRRRPAHRRREIAAELFDEIDRDPGMHPALTVEELRLIVERHDRPMPYVRMQVQTAAAVAPESHELIRRYIVSRRCQRYDETLPVEGIKELTAVRVIVRAPDQGTLAQSVAGARGTLFRPVTPAK